MPQSWMTQVGSLFGIRNEPQLEYEVLHKEGNKAIRRYKPYIKATVTVRGPISEARRTAFHTLLNYISGANSTRKEIAMTSPVLSEKTDAIQMSFVMPPGMTRSCLPFPLNPSIEFEEIPEKIVAVLTYSWSSNDWRNEKRGRELLSWLHAHGHYDPVGRPIWAGYDPPYAVPFLKKNEVMIDVIEAQRQLRAI